MMMIEIYTMTILNDNHIYHGIFSYHGTLQGSLKNRMSLEWYIKKVLSWCMSNNNVIIIRT